MADQPAGFEAALPYPLFNALFNPRSRRIGKGVKEVRAGNLTYSSTKEPKPLTPVEEAMLLHTSRIHVEAKLLLQHLMRCIQAMGLGGWVHAAFTSPLLLGASEYAKYGEGLGFRYDTPKENLLHHLDVNYSDQLYRHGYSSTPAGHDRQWHGVGG